MVALSSLLSPSLRLSPSLSVSHDRCHQALSGSCCPSPRTSSDVFVPRAGAGDTGKGDRPVICPPTPLLSPTRAVLPVSPCTQGSTPRPLHVPSLWPRMLFQFPWGWLPKIQASPKPHLLGEAAPSRAPSSRITCPRASSTAPPGPVTVVTCLSPELVPILQSTFAPYVSPALGQELAPSRPSVNPCPVRKQVPSALPPRVDPRSTCCLMWKVSLSSGLQYSEGLCHTHHWSFHWLRVGLGDRDEPHTCGCCLWAPTGDGQLTSEQQYEHSTVRARGETHGTHGAQGV